MEKFVKPRKVFHCRFSDDDGKNEEEVWKEVKILSIVVLGASGDLAKRKIFPAFFSLFLKDLFPTKALSIVGYARSDLNVQKLKDRALQFLEKTYRRHMKNTDGKYEQSKFKQTTDEFFDQHVHYHRGDYVKKEDFQSLEKLLVKLESGKEGKIGRLFYFSIPPHVFVDCSKNIAQTCKLSKELGENRVMIEKPFGESVCSFKFLQRKIRDDWDSNNLLRVDHYLGKEVVQNMLALRFANDANASETFRYSSKKNLTFKAVVITSTNLGLSGMISFPFLHFRDVLQNHMFQILTLLAMEAPVTLSKEDICLEKKKVLKNIEHLKPELTVVGQYAKSDSHDGYRDDKSVDSESTTPTFCACTLYIKNRRWDGVPFMLLCGKGLNESVVEVRIQFESVPGNLFEAELFNELVIRIQPNESIYFTVQSKVPGLGFDLSKVKMNFQLDSKNIPDAYERWFS